MGPDLGVEEGWAHSFLSFLSALSNHSASPPHSHSQKGCRATKEGGGHVPTLKGSELLNWKCQSPAPIPRPALDPREGGQQRGWVRLKIYLS